MRSIAVALALLATLATASACTKAASAAPEAKPAQAQASTIVSRPAPAEGARLLAAGALAVDVRTPGEFAEGHLDGALLFPVDELAARQDELAAALGGDRGRPVVVYCRSGARATSAASTLAAAGFTHVVNGGGLADLAPLVGGAR